MVRGVYVCEFWRVEFDKTHLTLYDNHVLYFDDEEPECADDDATRS